MDILLTAKGIIDGGDGLREYMSLLWLKVSNRVHGLVTCIIFKNVLVWLFVYKDIRLTCLPLVVGALLVFPWMHRD